MRCIVYTVTLAKARVERVSVSGNHYFDSATLKDLLSVHAADLSTTTESTARRWWRRRRRLEAVYQNNGFPR